MRYVTAASFVFAFLANWLWDRWGLDAWQSLACCGFLVVFATLGATWQWVRESEEAPR